MVYCQREFWAYSAHVRKHDHASGHLWQITLRSSNFFICLPIYFPISLRVITWPGTDWDSQLLHEWLSHMWCDFFLLSETSYAEKSLCQNTLKYQNTHSEIAYYPSQVLWVELGERVLKKICLYPQKWLPPKSVSPCIEGISVGRGKWSLNQRGTKLALVGYSEICLSMSLIRLAM